MQDLPLEQTEFSAQGLTRVMQSPRLWAEALLTTPTTSKPFQANFVQHQILDSTRRFNVIRVHRRAGKSFSFVILALYYALTIPSCEILIIGPAANHVERIFTDIRDFIRVNTWIHPYKVGDKQSPQRIEFNNGATILGLTTGARAKGAGMGIRGQGADVVLIDEGAYLDEGDWASLIPIMKGDENRRFPPRVFVASTPANTRGYYYKFCKDPRMKKAWNEIHVSIEDNPSLTPEFVEEARGLCPSELDWEREYLAEFPEIGDGVFPRGMVEASLKDFRYDVILKSVLDSRAKGEQQPTRTMGVDWDKYNKDGHGPNIVVLEALNRGRYRVIYREEIPQSKFTLTTAVNRVIELDRIFDPEWIYIDRGFGEYQLEEFQNRGLGHKVEGFMFKQNIECPLPGGGVEKKQFKNAMISVLRGWFERGLIDLSVHDRVFQEQWINYHVVRKTDNNLVFSNENEHGIDATGLAAMAMFMKIRNPYACKPATRSYHVQAPLPVARDRVRELRDQGVIYGKDFDPLEPPDTMRRSTLGRFGPSPRSSF